MFSRARIQLPQIPDAKHTFIFKRPYPNVKCCLLIISAQTPRSLCGSTIKALVPIQGVILKKIPAWFSPDEWYQNVYPLMDEMYHSLITVYINFQHDLSIDHSKEKQTQSKNQREGKLGNFVFGTINPSQL